MSNQAEEDQSMPTGENETLSSNKVNESPASLRFPIPPSAAFASHSSRGTVVPPQITSSWVTVDMQEGIAETIVQRSVEDELEESFDELAQRLRPLGSGNQPNTSSESIDKVFPHLLDLSPMSRQVLISDARAKKKVRTSGSHPIFTGPSAALSSSESMRLSISRLFPNISPETVENLVLAAQAKRAQVIKQQAELNLLESNVPITTIHKKRVAFQLPSSEGSHNSSLVDSSSPKSRHDTVSGNPSVTKESCDIPTQSHSQDSGNIRASSDESSSDSSSFPPPRRVNANSNPFDLTAEGGHGSRYGVFPTPIVATDRCPYDNLFHDHHHTIISENAIIQHAAVQHPGGACHCLASKYGFQITDCSLTHGEGRMYPHLANPFCLICSAHIAYAGERTLTHIRNHTEIRDVSQNRELRELDAEHICGQSFHLTCLAGHIKQQLRDGQKPSCPICMTDLPVKRARILQRLIKSIGAIVHSVRESIQKPK